MAAQDGNMIGVRLSSSNIYLTQAEADGLAEIVRQALICRTASQADDPLIVADASLTVSEAWRLLDRLEDNIDEAVDWADEGF